MKIIWVNHASFIFDHCNVRLICDPWLSGTAFNNGWNLLAETKFKLKDFSKITHIWISHEHPDHFSPATFKNIPKDFINNITVLYQYTKDKKVLNFIKRLGFKTIELIPKKPVKIAKDFYLISDKFGAEDSWLKIQTKDFSLLNMNDCPIRKKNDLEKLKQNIGKVDLLLTQFSYANWCGNKSEKTLRKKEALVYLKQMLNQIKFLKPNNVIPFASYIYFCHEENFYHNDSINKISFIYKMIKNNTNADCNVLYPGDTWEIGKSYNSANSIKKYNKDYDSLDKRTLKKTKKIPMNELLISSNKYKNDLKKRNWIFPLKILKYFGYLRETKIYLTDHKKSLAFSFSSGISFEDFPIKDSDIQLSSESLLYCLNNLWGVGTLAINARFTTSQNGSLRFFYRNFALSSENNAGRYFPKDYIVKLVRKIKNKLNMNFRFWISG